MRFVIRLFIFSSLFVLNGCASYTQQNLKLALQISPGMSKQQVLGIMGNPVSNYFSKGIEEWHYCKTNSVKYGDDFVALFFIDGEVAALKPYLVTADDVSVYGDCSKFVRMGNFSEPASIREVRIKYR